MFIASRGDLGYLIGYLFLFLESTKARGGSVMTFLVDGCRQNLGQRKIVERHGYNQRPHIRETDQLPLRYVLAEMLS